MVDNKNNDKDLHDYLQGDSDISNNYRKSNTLEPPAHLNEKILLAAREAINESELKPKAVFHKSPWALPVSIAAVISLSVSLIVTMQQETGQPLISEPKSALYDATIILEEKVDPKPAPVKEELFTADDISAQTSKQDALQDNIPASASLGVTDTYHTEETVRQLKDKHELSSLKKSRSSENTAPVISNDEKIEKRMTLEAASAVHNEVLELKREQPFTQEEKVLLAIKALWHDGDFNQARQVYGEFIKNHPDFNLKCIKEILGLELYQALNE